jgi:hypothetical protein
VSDEIALHVAGDPGASRPDLVWGEPSNGLRSAVEFRSSTDTEQARRDERRGEFPHGARLNVYVHVQNISLQPITFWSEDWRQDDQVTLIDAEGAEQQLTHSLYTGWAQVEHWTLKPGQTAILQAITLGIAASNEAARQFDHPIGPVIVGKPGKYRLRYAVRFNAWQRQDADGKKVIPGSDDWQGTLVTGDAAITLRERRPADELPTFSGRLEFQTDDGTPIDSGTVKVNVQSNWHPLFDGPLTGPTQEIPGCSREPLTVYALVPGFEETRFHDVPVRPDRATVLRLPPAQPVRLRLVTRQGAPVVGAQVRYFNRSKLEAGTGPYPMSGLNGTVWATSKANGDVVLDMLQKQDPADNKLGNNIYWFYIESPGWAPRFIGPVQAGEDLGDVVVGPLLEARGEIRGTAEELAAFAAEWDQPEPMKRGNGEAAWYYAESKQLETLSKGDKLTFHLTGLRPGTLRVVARFKAGGKAVSHVYTRRDPNEDDVVFEFPLNDSRHDLVVSSQGPVGEQVQGLSPCIFVH